MHVAVRFSSLRCLSLLLELYAKRGHQHRMSSLSSAMAGGPTVPPALHVAAVMGSAPAVAMLLDAGANASIVDAVSDRLILRIHQDQLTPRSADSQQIRLLKHVVCRILPP